MIAPMPDESGTPPSPDDNATEDGPSEGSLLGEIGALIDDGKTYAEAELAFQKTRAAYVGQHAKGIAISGGIAILLVILAIVALVFGAILALTPYIGAIGATVAVFGSLLLAAALLVQRAKAKARAMMRAFIGDEE